MEKSIMESNVLFSVLGKTVWVQVDENPEYHVKGKLIYFQKGSKKPHLPSVLILLREDGEYVICRWRKIFWKTGGMKRQVKR